MTVQDMSLGRPIDGTITRATSYRTEQGTPAEFLAAVDLLLATEGVAGIKWDQYIPYFNDGEPCEFGVGEVRVLLAGDIEIDEDQSDYGDRSLDPNYLFNYGDLGGPRPSYASWNDRAAYDVWSAKHHAEENKIYFVSREVAQGIESAFRGLSIDRFEDVIRANFGDHSTVTTTTEGFSVEQYEHE
jgi:hypothetical protein